MALHFELVTPARLVDSWITDRGVLDAEGLPALAAWGRRG